jgi:epoxyqueuosine reductase
LQNQNFEIVGFFYNPNIQPLAEYQKRRQAAQKFFADKKIDLVAPVATENYDKNFQLVVKNRIEKPARCLACYELRLREAARQARALNCPYFTSTLLISPHQDILAIKRIGEKYGQLNQVSFYSPDYGRKKYKGFRPFFTAGRKLAHQADLYEQEYCGCFFSLRERFAKPNK